MVEMGKTEMAAVRVGAGSWLIMGATSMSVAEAVLQHRVH